MATAAITALSHQQHEGNQRQPSLRRMNTAKASVYASLASSIEIEDEEKTRESLPGERRQSKRFQDSSRARIPRNSRCIIDPKSSFQRKWDVVMMILLLFVAIVTPYEVGFLDIQDMTHPLWIIVSFFAEVFCLSHHTSPKSCFVTTMA